MSAAGPIQQQRFSLLKQLYEASGGNQADFQDLHRVAQAAGLDQEQALVAAQYLEGDGLIRAQWVMGGGAVINLTQAGVDAAERRASSPARRAEQGRQRASLLRRLYEASGGNQHDFHQLKQLGDAAGLEDQQAILAAQHLEGEGLIRAQWLMGGDAMVNITHAGVRQAERLGH